MSTSVMSHTGKGGDQQTCLNVLSEGQAEKIIIHISPIVFEKRDVLLNLFVLRRECY
jgi:hypothetical protein